MVEGLEQAVDFGDRLAARRLGATGVGEGAGKVGRPLQFGQKFGELDQYRAVTDLLGKYNVPIVMDLDIGHLHPAMPLIVGSYAKVAVEGNEIEIKMECR